SQKKMVSSEEDGTGIRARPNCALISAASRSARFAVSSPALDSVPMSDFLLGVASPEFWRDCGFALSATGVIGIVAVIIFPDDKRRLQKGLALAFVALLLVGYAFARFGESALLAEARERADEAEVELAHRARSRPTRSAASRRSCANSPARGLPA